MVLQLLSREESERRFGKVREQMRALGLNAIILSDNANLYYLTGRV